MQNDTSLINQIFQSKPPKISQKDQVIHQINKINQYLFTTRFTVGWTKM